MVDNKSKEKIKIEWKERLQARVPDVKKELLLLEKGPQIPHVKSDCPEKLKGLAERLVALQVDIGDYRREDIETSDMYKIKDISKATGMSFRDVIASLVENDAYVNYEVIDARHIIQLLAEFDAAYETFYPKYNAFPINVLSPDVRHYLKQPARGISLQEKLQTLLEVYRPELSGINFDEHNYEALPKSRIVLSEQNIELIKAQLSSVAKQGNIDVIFSKKYEAYFKNLCSKLKLAGYTFDRFVNEHTDFSYTLCFKADILPAVKQMATAYYFEHGTTKGMTTNDPYLRYKVEVAQNLVGLYTTKEIFDYLDLPSDNPDFTAKTISTVDLKRRDKKLFDSLREIYPDGVIQKGFATAQDRMYDELCMLAKRFGFKSIDDYISNHGFTRIVDKKSTESKIYLSERDLLKYGFIQNCKSPEEIDERLASFGISYVGPYENLGIYRKLAYERQDGTYCAPASRKFE